jgi:RND family efflux transporter MFP subunit
MSNTAERSPSKLTRRQITIGALLTLGALLFVGYQSGALTSLAASQTTAAASTPIENQPTILPVNARAAEFVESIEQSRTYTGTVRARRRSELAFEIAGKVADVLVDEGDQVAAGQIIARLDTATLEAQQAAILARLASSQSLMSELESGPRQEKIKAAEAEVAAAKSDYENATVRLKRRESLIKSRAIPVEEYDQAKFDLRTATAQLQSAGQRLAELNAGTRQERLSAQQAAVRQLQASAQEMQVAIEKCELVAPYAATITRRHVDPGSIVQPTRPVCKLVEHSKLEAWIGLPIEVAAKIQTGQEYAVAVGPDQYPVTAAAKIGELDQATRTQTVLFNFDSQAAKSVVSGQLCQIQITNLVDSSGVWIPNSALAKGIRGLSTVMILAPEPNSPDLYRIQKRDIEIIKTDSDRVLARGTIADGDLIVADGLHRITDGQLVSLAQPAE